MVTVAGAVLVAVVIAIAASPLMPIGAARLAEPPRGSSVNLAVLGAGLALFALVAAALLAQWSGRNAARAQGPLGVAEPGRPGRVSRLGAPCGRTGSVTGGIGVRMAFEPGHGRTAVPVRSALIGTIVAIASVLAALVFGTSLISLVATPHRYGQNWPQMLDLGFGGVTGPLAAKILATEPASPPMRSATTASSAWAPPGPSCPRSASPRSAGGTSSDAAGRPAAGRRGRNRPGRADHAGGARRLGQAMRITVNQVNEPALVPPVTR